MLRQVFYATLAGMEKDNKNKGDMAPIYEVSYLILPSLATEQVPAKASSIMEMIVKAGGDVISSESPTLIDLAYPMVKVVQTKHQKCHSGYFGWVKFEMTKGEVGEIKKNLDSDDNILRYLIVKTVRENTLLNGKMMLKSEKEEKKIDVVAEEVIEEVLPESTPEEIDKSIDELVIN